MIEFEGLYYDGRSSAAHLVTVTADERELAIRDETLDVHLPISDAEILTGVGSARTIIRLKEGGEIHIQESAILDRLATLLPVRSPETLARFLEQKALYALGALAITILIIGGFLRYGLPEIARYTAAILPPDVGIRLGKETLSTLEELYLRPSSLDTERQNTLRVALHQACQSSECPDYTLLFRQSSALGANAFALPDRTIVLTDELVKKARHDDEIVAVLLHELGHVRNEHIERMLLQSLGSGMILVMITGDIGNFSDLAAGIPAILLQQGYSRAMEDEADRFALDALHAAQIDPKRFADILLRITRDAPDQGTLFSSHPDTLERVRPFLEKKED